MGCLQGQVISHAMNGSTSHQQRPLSPPSYPPPPTSLRTGLHRQSRSSGKLQILCFFISFWIQLKKHYKELLLCTRPPGIILFLLFWSPEGSESITRESVVSGLTSVSNTVPIARFSEEEKRVSVIKAPHYEGIGPVDESGIPIAIRTVSCKVKMITEPVTYLPTSPALAFFG